MKEIIHYGNHIIKAYPGSGSFSGSKDPVSFSVTLRGRHITRGTIFELIEYIDKLPPAKKAVELVAAYKIGNQGDLTDKGVITAVREENPEVVFFSYEDKSGSHLHQVNLNELAADTPANLELQKEILAIQKKDNEAYEIRQTQANEARRKCKELATKFVSPSLEGLTE